MLKFAILGETDAPPKVPPSLTVAQSTWIRWRLGLLKGHIGLVAPLAPVLMRYTTAESAPPLWLLTALPVGILAVGGAVGALIWRRLRHTE